MNDQERISPYNNNIKISDGNKKKYQLGDFLVYQYQFSKVNMCIVKN